MGATARAVDENTHELTGKLGPGGERHAPQWTEWTWEWPGRRGGIYRRFCLHPDCDVEDWEQTFDGNPPGDNQ